MDNDEVDDDLLDEWGKNGWELISVVIYDGQGLAYLRRQLGHEAFILRRQLDKENQKA